MHKLCTIFGVLAVIIIEFMSVDSHLIGA